jgi:hypothetical protein
MRGESRNKKYWCGFPIKILCGLIKFINQNYRKEALKKGVICFTYLSSIEVWFGNRRFPIEIIMPGGYMKIKSKQFWWSKNIRFIAETCTSLNRIYLYKREVS